MNSIQKITIIALLVFARFTAEAQIQSWIPVGSYNTYTAINTLKSINNNIYASNYDPDSSRAFITKWNGNFWYKYPYILNSVYYAGFDVLNDTLFVAYRQGAMLVKVKKFSSGSWVNVPTPTYTTSTGVVNLMTLNNELYMYGDMKDSAGVGISLVKYNNGAWTTIGPSSKPGIFGEITKLGWYNSKLLVSGKNYLVANSSSLSSKNITWDGSAWQKFNNPLDSGELLYMQADTIFYLKDTTGTLGTKMFYKYFNNNAIKINHNLVGGGFTYTPAFISHNGTYYVFGNFSGTQGLRQLVHDSAWVSVPNGNDPGRLILTIHNNELYSTYNSGRGVDRLSDSLSFIKGNIFHDLDNNCTKQTGEADLKNSRKVTVMPDNITTIADINGNYYMAVSPGSKTISNQRLTGSKYLISSSCSSKSIAVTALKDSTYTINFAMQDSASITDVGVKIFPNGGNRIRKFTTDYVHIQVSNYGTTNVSSGTLKLRLNPLMTVLFSSPAYSSYTNNIVTWNYTNLGVDSIMKFTLAVNLSNSAVLGDTITYLAWVTPNPDNDTTDNIDSAKCVILSSYDPNFKQCFPADVILPNTKQLDYTVHFQNTGTSPAINVYVVDTVDTNLPMDKIEITGWSTPKRPKIEVLNNVLTFSFFDIMLPDSTSNEAASHGFISYRSLLTKPLAIGTVVKNRADIYFDYNDPILTNTTLNVRLDKVGVTTIHEKNYNITVYPNPAHDKLTIDIASIHTQLQGREQNNIIEILDINGREIMTENIPKGDSDKTIDIKTLVNGIYILRIYNGEELISTNKISVIK